MQATIITTATTTTITTNMTEAAGLIRLMSWFSPAMPTGTFAYSGGLETAVHDRRVVTAEQLHDWIGTSLFHGVAWNDAVLMAESWRCGHDGQDANLGEIADLAVGLAGSHARLDETLSLGRSFLHAAALWPAMAGAANMTTDDVPYPVATGWACGKAGIPLSRTVAALLQGYVSAQLQVAIRLSVVGQFEAAKLLAGFETVISAAADSASATTRNDLGSCAMLAEIAAMRHETLESRLFRS